MPQAKFDVVLFGGTHHSTGPARSTGIHRLATELRENGYSVHAMDYLTFLIEVLSDDQRAEVLAKYISEDTLMVGLSTTLLSRVMDNGDVFWWGMASDRVTRLMKEIRKIAPNVKFAVGGSQVIKTEIPFIAQFYSHMSDYWVCGQAEVSFLALANHLRYGDELRSHDVEGIRVIYEQDYPYESFSRSTIEWPEHAFVQRGESLPMEVARGCIFKCAFCSYALIGKTWGDMSRHADVMRQDLIRNYERYGTTRYIMTDDTINDSMEKVRFLHSLFTSLPFKIEWMAYARLDLFWKFPEMAQILMDAGMRGAVFGIETMHHEAGKRVGKGLGPEKIKQTLNNCRAIWGDTVHITGLFILGLPGEPVESMEETLRYLDSDDCPIDSVNVTPLQISSERAVSRMDKNKESFGYKRADERKWTHYEDWVSDLTSAIEMRKMAIDFLTRPSLDAKPLYQTRTDFVLFTHYSLVDSNMIRTIPSQIAAKQIEKLQIEALRNYFELAAVWKPSIDHVPSTQRIAPVIYPKDQR